MRRLLEPWGGYIVALAAVALAIGLRELLHPYIGRGAATATLYGAIAIAVWYGGFRPAFFAAVVGYLGANYLFMDPRGILALDNARDVARLGAYVFSSLLIIGLGGAMHAARKRAEAVAAELATSEERFRAFMEHTPDCVFIKDEEGRYLFVNAAAEKLLRAENGAWRGKTDLDLLPENLAKTIQRRDREILERNAPVPYDLSMADGYGSRELRSMKFPLRDSVGRRYVGAITTDVTEQRGATRALDEARKQLQIVADTMPAAVVWTGRDLRYRWVNPVYSRWAQKRPEDIVGRHVAEVLSAEQLAEVKPYIERAMESGEQVSCDRLADYPGLGRRWISVTFTPTRNDGEVDGFVTVALDIHDRRLADDALREADRRKDDFLAMLAHELRNPLAPIRNAVAVLGRKESADPELAWSREVIGRQVHQMTRLIEDLLDIERISRGRLLIRKERILLERVIDTAIETSRPHIAAAGHHLSVVLPPERVLVEADPVRLAQVFSNLLNNSAKYTEARGNIVLAAEVEGDSVSVVVEDDGIGFGPDTATGLFKPYTQLAAASPRSIGGLGIGLSLVQGIVALHGGTVEAHSDGAGKGSRFTVRLPVAAQAADALQQAAKPQAAAEVQGPAVRVLVADDNQDAADSMQRILRLYGHEVEVVYDGAAALDVADRFRPRIAVLDIGMPGLNGYDVARMFRQRHGKDVVLIALTGWGQEADRRRSLESGFDLHLTKPVDPGELNDLIARAAGDAQ